MSFRTILTQLLAALSVAVTASAPASPPQPNELGARFTVLSKGATSTIEIRLSPKAAFESVRVEAASGVGSITPPCAFAQVEAGQSYSCRVDVTPKAGESALTLNVVGEKAAEAGHARVVEVRHFTLATGQAATTHAASTKPVPGLALTPGQSSTK
ncbi:MAG TPA: hypothetical protein VH109_02700 [Steroidobacteraceae bacterium]|jgi:hypothetical protein|nr:hypothetical protein [Steroidobacteraceae bacterium]